ncbi:DeoR/GlpR family DNA-binding transcription regulator [Pseudarthrobacter sp. DSP2-3-2b1]|uniref:DeoR/GlpR family DNA-binding transcription regulator n=1 Tax=Pseudarthrobacter sp. DSP2-3-2b1 TaxID=2804661 RepID=UPI003CF73E50
MLAAQRQHLILQELMDAGTVRVAALAARLDVSEMTVRRDIDALDAGGLLLRVHGGAARTDSFSALEPGFAVKSTRELDAKAAIAAAALDLIRPGMTVFLSGGTTTFELARILPRNLGITVATNSIMVAHSLGSGEPATPAGESDVNEGQPRDGIRILILGGERTPSEALVGPLAAQAAKAIAADLCFMGVHGMDLEAGISSPNMLEAEVNAAMIAASGKLVVLADATKYGVVGLAGIAPLAAVDILITDQGISANAATSLRGAVRQLRITPEAA